VIDEKYKIFVEEEPKSKEDGEKISALSEVRGGTR
jgi:hypothetical protein